MPIKISIDKGLAAYYATVVAAWSLVPGCFDRWRAVIGAAHTMAGGDSRWKENVTNEAKRLLKTKDIIFRNHLKANRSMKVKDLFF